jgi:hypothetical protein
VEGGRDAWPALRRHWGGFITRDDFAWLAGVGINAVRIPVGHWILGPPYPWHAAYGAERTPFVTGGIEVLRPAPGAMSTQSQMDPSCCAGRRRESTRDIASAVSELRLHSARADPGTSKDGCHSGQ